LAFLPLLNRDVLGLDANGSRMTMPLMVLGSVALAGYLRGARSSTPDSVDIATSDDLA
jgi:hypothetical protein